MKSGSEAKTVLLTGATGTIGRAVAVELLARGHQVICPLRARQALPEGAEPVFAEVTQAGGLSMLHGRSIDAVVSCLASRSGAPRDAWAIDHAAQMNVLDFARTAGVPQFVLLSAICVQKPLLAFQKAKLAFEAELASSGLTYSIVRPTAFFKSLSGQLDRLRAGKPFLIFGDGALTACKPISDADLATYIADCLNSTDLQNRILPIGGPGPALTPRAQGEALFAALGLAPRFRKVPIALMDTIIGGLALAGRISTKAAQKAELARIGRYYATESMLVWDAQRAVYDAAATPETGTQTLPEFYAKLARGEVTIDRGDHAVF